MNNINFKCIFRQNVFKICYILKHTYIHLNQEKAEVNNMLNSFSDIPDQTSNFSVFYKEPFDDNERCNWYSKDGNTGPSYSCDQTGQIVAIRRWDTAILSVCNITVYGGKISSLSIHQLSACVVK